MRDLIKALTCALAVTLAVAGCAAKEAASAASPQPAATVTPAPDGPQVRIVTTAGTIVVLLDPAHAPKTVANFLRYVDAKFFNQGTFFRVIPGFVIQGGNQARESAHDYPPIALEDPKTTGVYNVDGAIAMARTNDPDSATSEFFIDDGPQTALDGAPGAAGYAAFGVVTSGMDVVRAIARLPAQDEHLLKPITILKIERVK